MARSGFGGTIVGQETSIQSLPHALVLFPVSDGPRCLIWPQTQAFVITTFCSQSAFLMRVMSQAGIWETGSGWRELCGMFIKEFTWNQHPRKGKEADRSGQREKPKASAS